MQLQIHPLTCVRNLLTWSLLLLATAFAQEAPGKWGKPAPHEQALKALPPLPDAIILSDRGTWSPHDLDRGLMKLEREVRIKVLRYHDSLPFPVAIRYRGQNQSERVRRLEAHTLVPKEKGNGYRRIPLSLNRLPGVEEVFPWQRISFQFLAVQAGAILEYRYTLITDQIETLQPWWFQDTLPTQYSEVRIRGVEKGTFLNASVGKLTRAKEKGFRAGGFVATSPPGIPQPTLEPPPRIG